MELCWVSHFDYLPVATHPPCSSEYPLQPVSLASEYMTVSAEGFCHLSWTLNWPMQKDPKSNSIEIHILNCWHHVSLAFSAALKLHIIIQLKGPKAMATEASSPSMLAKSFAGVWWLFLTLCSHPHKAVNFCSGTLSWPCFCTCSVSIWQWPSLSPQHKTIIDVHDYP